MFGKKAAIISLGSAYFIKNIIMINNYKKQLEALLKNTITFYNDDCELIYDHLNWIKDKGSLKINVRENDLLISTFKLVQMPGCCGICISTGVWVKFTYRNKGINTILNKFRIDITKLLGYGILLCTDVSNNIAEVKTLDKNGWKHIYNFKNPRTSNKINISIKELN